MTDNSELLKFARSLDAHDVNCDPVEAMAVITRLCDALEGCQDTHPPARRHADGQLTGGASPKGGGCTLEPPEGPKAIPARTSPQPNQTAACQAPPEPQWSPIETAPKDKPVLVFDGAEQMVSRWVEEVRWERCRYESTPDREVTVRVVDGWWECFCGSVAHPTHWLPLAASPSLKEKTDV